MYVCESVQCDVLVYSDVLMSRKSYINAFNR